MTPPGTAVPLNIVRDNAKRQLQVTLGELPVETTASAPAAAEPTAAQLGFRVQDLTNDLASQLGYENTNGVLVAQIDQNSEAYQAGIRRGMVIRQVNRQEVSNTAEFQAALTSSEHPQQILLLVQDQQATRYVVLPLG
jgi:serine protease Do